MALSGDMLPRSELQHQQRGFTFDMKNPEPVISLLRHRMVTGELEPCAHGFIHEADPYSAAPADLVRDLRHAPGNGKGVAWYMMSLANYRQMSAQGGSIPKARGRHGSTPYRQREVRGGDGEVCGLWRTEKRKEAVRDAGGRVVGYARTLYYWSKTGTMIEKIGWCMIEFWLEQQDGADQQLVLCKVYRSNRKRYEQSSTAASSEAAQVDQRPLSHDDQMSFAVASEEEAPDGGESPVVVLPSMGNTATNLLLAAEKAVSCDFEKACEIDEFVMLKELHLRTIDELGLDRSILSDRLFLCAGHLNSFDLYHTPAYKLAASLRRIIDELEVRENKNKGSMHQLEVRLRHIAMDKELTPAARDRIVSYAESMSQIILSAYLNEVGERARQGFNALQRIGVNVHDQVSKRACKVTNVSLVVDDSQGNQSVRVLYSAFLEDGVVSKVDGEENERPIQLVNSSATASSSGVKRKADRVHPEAPPSVRQELAYTNHPVPVDSNNVGDPYEPFSDILKDNVPLRVDDGDSARLSPGVSRMVEEYLQDPIIAVDHGGECAGFPFPPGTGESGTERLGLAEMVEGGSAPCRDLEETGHQDTTGLEDFALKNSARRSLHGSGGDSTGLVAAEPDVEDNSVPIGVDDGWDWGDLDWLKH